MGSDANRLRSKWQDYAGTNAAAAEINFYVVFNQIFEGTEYQIIRRPRDFHNLYIDVTLSQQDLQEIYTPNIPIERHGVIPDYAIHNSITNKTIYVEVKRQDGWVEGGVRSDGRGNAHERSCKYFTPGLMKELQVRGNLPNYVLPFWIVFQGNITRDPCRVREIAFWFNDYSSHYFFWRDSTTPLPLIEHFLVKIMPLLEK